MGCSWSLYFAQSVTEAIASLAPAVNGLSPLHDTSKDLVLGRHEGAQAYYVYVDILGVMQTLSWNSGKTSSLKMVFPSTNQNCH